jgi:hypothetical protein
VNKLQIDTFVKNGKYSEEKEMILYTRFCNNESTKSPAEQASLKCFYQSKNAFTKIALFKVVELDHRTTVQRKRN